MIEPHPLFGPCDLDLFQGTLHIGLLSEDVLWEIFGGGGCTDPITAWPHIAWTSHLFSRLPAVCLQQWSSQIQIDVAVSTSSTHALMVKPCTTLEQSKLWWTLKFALTCLARERADSNPGDCSRKCSLSYSRTLTSNLRVKSHDKMICRQSNVSCAISFTVFILC